MNISATTKHIAPLFALLLLAPAACSDDDGASGSTGSDAAADAGPKLDHAFPEGFLWGTATAGFQVDMGCPTMPADKCEDRHSDWYQFITDKDLVADKSLHIKGEPPAIGPGMWETYDADFKRAGQELHNNAIRLSIEWSRLFPKADAAAAKTVADLDKFADKDAVAHYRKMFASANAHGLQLLVTLNHYTLPLWVHDGKACNADLAGCKARGWLDPENEKRIALYAGFCAKTFGDQVDLWATLNEPFAVIMAGYVLPSADRTNPPGVYLKVKEGIDVAQAMIRGHAGMYDAIHANDKADVDKDGKSALVGLVPNLAATSPSKPDSAADKEAVKRFDYVYNRYFLEALVHGKWDGDLDGKVDKVDDTLKGRMDYIGINYYTRIYVTEGEIPGTTYPMLKFLPDQSKGVWNFDPTGLGEVIELAGSYGVPIYITENGTFEDKATAFDSFMKPHFEVLHAAIDKGADVRGYFCWSLLDNYEWNHGMALRFGLYSVDTADKAKPRTLTKMGQRYGEVAKANGF